MQFKAGWYVNTKTTSEQSFCFCTFFSNSALETECTLLISGFTFLLKYPLFSNHDSNSLNLLFKFPSSEQILFILIACPYGIALFIQLRWQDFACKYWCVSVSLKYKSVAKCLFSLYTTTSRKLI